jgi:hypothetical protein
MVLFLSWFYLTGEHTGGWSYQGLQFRGLAWAFQWLGYILKAWHGVGNPDAGSKIPRVDKKGWSKGKKWCFEILLRHILLLDESLKQPSKASWRDEPKRTSDVPLFRCLYFVRFRSHECRVSQPMFLVRRSRKFFCSYGNLAKCAPLPPTTA